MDDTQTHSKGLTRWWHYTLGTTLIRIIADRRIKRAKAFVAKGERAAVWFSCRETWEPTATKGFLEAGASPTEHRRATVEEMIVGGGALIRIEVPEAVARHTWADHRRLSNVDPRIADALERGAGETGADPLQWRVSYHDVPLSQVLSVEAWLPDKDLWTTVGAPLGGHEGLGLDRRFIETVRAALGLGRED